LDENSAGASVMIFPYPVKFVSLKILFLQFLFNFVDELETASIPEKKELIKIVGRRSLSIVRDRKSIVTLDPSPQ